MKGLAAVEQPGNLGSGALNFFGLSICALVRKLITGKQLD